jgi:hypothetical protein
MTENEGLITPTLIYRAEADKLELVELERRGKVSLLAFMNPEKAEKFRNETGCYPESEGFGVKATEVDEIRVIVEALGYEHVALLGPEPDTVSYLKSADLIGILEEQEEILVAL